MVGKSKVFVYHSHHTNLSFEFISFGCPPVFGGRGGVPKRTHVELEDDVVWDWVTIGWELVMAWQLIKGTGATTCYTSCDFPREPIHEKFLHGILKKTKQDMYGSSNPKGYHWKNKVSTPALWIVWTMLIKKGDKGDNITEMTLSSQSNCASATKKKTHILSIILVV